MDSLGVIVNLEQEKHVVFVYLGVVSLNELIDLFYYLVLVCLNQSIFLDYLSLIVLVQIEVALEKSMVEVEPSQLL